MRVLIFTAFVACAAAAPSPLVSPLVYQPAIIPGILPTAVPTISAGDIQGAASEAQAKINDLARATVDQAIANANARSQVDDLTKEKIEEAFWTNEDQKWQAIDAVKTAEAAIDGAVASKVPEYAKSVVAGQVTPYVTSVSPVAPVVTGVISSSFTPFVNNPYLPIVQAIKTPTVADKGEENNEVKDESAINSVEVAKSAVETETKMEAVTEKVPENTIVLANSVLTPYSGVNGYNLGVPAFGNYISQPIVNYAQFQTIPSVFSLTYLRNYW